MACTGTLQRAVQGRIAARSPFAETLTSGSVQPILVPSLHIKVQGNTYKDVVRTAVDGAVDGIDCVTIDCQPNENVEVLCVFTLNKKIKARPVGKLMHRQRFYKDVPAYMNGVSEAVFKVSPYVSDDES